MILMPNRCDSWDLSHVRMGRGLLWVFLFMCGVAGADREDLIREDSAVSSSEYNHASSLLFQWWGLFEGPDGNDVSAYFDTVFSEDVHLTFGEMDINGIRALREVYASLPMGVKSAHHVEDIQLIRAADDDYRLIVDFVYQKQVGDEAVSTNRLQYNHKLERQAGNNFTLRDVASRHVESLAPTPFKTTYKKNRARAALLNYLGIIDVLDGGYTELASIMDSTTELHDVIESSDTRFSERRDGVLLGRKEIAEWLATRKETFESVAHQLTDIDIVEEAGDRITVTLDVFTQAWPFESDTIRVDGKYIVELRDTGERFMIIEKIRRKPR